MAKCGGKNTIVELINNRVQNGQTRFMNEATIARETGISPERVRRILERPTNRGLFRRSRGNRPNVWTLVQLDN